MQFIIKNHLMINVVKVPKSSPRKLPIRMNHKERNFRRIFEKEISLKKNGHIFLWKFHSLWFILIGNFWGLDFGTFTTFIIKWFLMINCINTFNDKRRKNPLFNDENHYFFVDCKSYLLWWIVNFIIYTRNLGKKKINARYV